jgi:nucleotide-binding universal stress UspA family protein
MKTLFHRVLVAVGEVKEDVDFLRYARVVQDLVPDAEFSFVHVLNWPGNRRSLNQSMTHAEAASELAASVGQHFGEGSKARCSVRHGNVVDRLLECSAELPADLILIGHAREHLGRRSIARNLAMQAPCSLWMRPYGSKSTVKRILAAVDFSEPSAYALTMGAHIARLAGDSRCMALHAYLNEGSVTTEEYESIDLLREREAFQRFVAPLDTAGVDVQPMLEEGASVAHAVERIAESHSVDLVVMGSRGQSKSVSTLLGSESEHVLTESKVPVLIAKRRGDRIGLLQALLDRDFRLHEPPQFG